MVEGIAEVLHHPVAVYIRVHFTGWIYFDHNRGSGVILNVMQRLHRSLELLRADFVNLTFEEGISPHFK